MDSEIAPDIPSPLDYSHIIEILSDSPRLNIGEALYRDIPDPGERWAKRELEPMLEGTSSTGISAKESHVLEYRDLLADIVRYNHAGASKNVPEHEFATPENDSADLRERMMEKWAHRHETQAWKDLCKQKADRDEARRCRFERGVVLSEAEEDKEQRLWHKTVRAANKEKWKECEKAVLDDFKETLGHGDYAESIQELADLQIMHDIQKAELNTRAAKPNVLILEACAKVDALTGMTEDHLCSVDTKAQVLGPLLNMSVKNMERLHTRVGRLVAKDVRDDEARRQEVMERRLQHKDTLDFMFEAKTELETVKAIANSTRKFVEEMEVELNEVGRAAVDANGGLKDARLAMAFQEK